jgi:hypothetical protein
MPDSAPSIATTQRVRFASSPTGYRHVGGVPTSLFNWLFARYTAVTSVRPNDGADFERPSHATASHGRELCHARINQADFHFHFSIEFIPRT